MTFGQKLQNLLYEHNISQKQLALALKMPPTTLSGYITDKREPDFMALLQIANYFQVSTDYLIGNQQKDLLHYEDSSPTKKELRSFYYYRKLHPTQKDLIDQMINTMTKQNSKEKEIL